MARRSRPCRGRARGCPESEWKSAEVGNCPGMSSRPAADASITLGGGSDRLRSPPHQNVSPRRRNSRRSPRSRAPARRGFFLLLRGTYNEAASLRWPLMQSESSKFQRSFVDAARREPGCPVQARLTSSQAAAPAPTTRASDVRSLQPPARRDALGNNHSIGRGRDNLSARYRKNRRRGCGHLGGGASLLVEPAAAAHQSPTGKFPPRRALGVASVYAGD